MKTKPVTIIVSLITAILLPIVLTPWKIPRIGQTTIGLVGAYDFSRECWPAVVFLKNAPKTGISFSPLWNPSRGERLNIINPPSSIWGDVLNPQNGVPRDIVKAGFRVIGKGSAYKLSLCKRGEIAWEVVVIEVVLPLFGGGVVLLRKRKNNRPVQRDRTDERA